MAVVFVDINAPVPGRLIQYREHSRLSQAVDKLFCEKDEV